MEIQEIDPGQSPDETGYTLAAELRAEARIEANLSILSSKEPVNNVRVVELTELAGQIALRANAKDTLPLQ